MELSKMSLHEIKQYIAALSGESLLQAAEILRQDTRNTVRKLGETIQKKEQKRFAEENRLEQMWQIEDQVRMRGYRAICGCDEVGRGPLAGSVVAAAVILPRNCKLIGLNDSKKLSEKNREQLDREIRDQAIAVSIAEMSPRVIDAVNILEASRLAMQAAVEGLEKKADFVVVDGWENPHFQLPQKAVIKGDSKCISVAAASVVAKVYRDHMMVEMDQKYPGYGFAEHKGYPTKQHYEALKKMGPCEIHRISFDLKLEKDR